MAAAYSPNPAARRTTTALAGQGRVQLKDRVANVGQFLDAVRRVAAGGTAIDPEPRRPSASSACP
ncbi:MAG TPA: hypothetical protein VI751_14375, partial [Actinomycetota bacterium]